MIACVLILLCFNSGFAESLEFENEKYNSLRYTNEIPDIHSSDEEPIAFNGAEKHFLHHHHHHNKEIENDHQQDLDQQHSDMKKDPPAVPSETSDDVDAKVRYFISTENFMELALDEAKNIFSTDWYNASRTTVFFTHGFTGHPGGPAVNAVISTYLKYGNVNVVLLNWERMAAGAPPTLASSYLNHAMPNTKKLGVVFANTLLEMSKKGLDLNKTHLIGHSLGAHLFGITGNNLQEKGVQLPWITGLDPASIGFDGRPPSGRLNPDSAAFVSVIHSDPSKYGYSKPLGTVDFWPNFKIGSVVQPGCSNQPQPMFSPKDLCNHNRAWELLVDSIKHPDSLLGSYAKNYRKWKAYSSAERIANTFAIGSLGSNMLKGSYFLTTNSETPFGRGQNGL